MFDFTGRMEALVEDIVRRLPVFAHVRTERLLVTLSRARRGGLSGTYARIFPLRFEHGATRTVRRTGGAIQSYEMPRLVHQGRDILYIVTFLLPRFQNLDFDTKVTTVIHELYHVGERCDGDIRRLPGKNFAHGHSRDVYDRKMAALAREYLALPGHEGVTGFLRDGFRALERRFGAVAGRRLAPPAPRLVATEPAPRRRAVVPGTQPAPPPFAPRPFPVLPVGQLTFPFANPSPARRRAPRPGGI
jgi:predicted metallopeptidase